MEACHRIAASVARSTPASAMRVANVCASCRTVRMTSPFSHIRVMSAVQPADVVSWFARRRENPCPRSGDSPILPARIAQLSGVKSRMRRAAADFPHWICTCQRFFARSTRALDSAPSPIPETRFEHHGPPEPLSGGLAGGLPAAQSDVPPRLRVPRSRFVLWRPICGSCVIPAVQLKSVVPLPVANT